MGGYGRRAAGRPLAAVAAVVAVLGTTACTADAAPRAQASAVAAAPTATRGDAALSRFAEVATAVARKQDPPGGMDFIRALEAAGWDRSVLQVTADRTSVGLRVPAVQFAAEDGGSCLIGQYGDAGLQVLRADPVDGACLIGETRPLG